MQHVTSFTMFDSYHVALFTLQTRDFEKIQDGPQCVKWCISSSRQIFLAYNIIKRYSYSLHYLVFHFKSKKSFWCISECDSALFELR